MNGCTIKGPDTSKAKALNIIQNEFGANVDGFIDVLTKVVDNYESGLMKPSKEFSEYYAAHNHGELPDFNKGTGKKVHDAIMRFVKRDLVDINSSTTAKHNNASPEAKLYTDPATRNLGKKLAIGYFNDFYAQTVFDNAAKGMQIDDSRAFYTDAVAGRFTDMLFSRIAEKEGKSLDDMYADDSTLFTEDGNFNYDEVFKRIGGDKASTQDKNLYAIFREMTGENSEAYFDEMFRDGRLNYLKLKKSDSDQEINNQADREEEGDVAREDNKKSARDWSDDDSPSFIDDLDKDLRTWFGSIKKLRSTEKVGDKDDYDTNNNFGIPERLDASETVNTLIHLLVGANNKEEAINRIRTAANSIPDRASYAIIADQMERNDDLANRVMRNLAKIVGSKSMIVVRDGRVAAQISNTRSNNTDALFGDFSNTVKAAAISTGDSTTFRDNIQMAANGITKKGLPGYEAVGAIMTMDKNELLDSGIDIEEGYRRLNNFTGLIRQYFPSIPTSAIHNFIKQANGGDWAGNIQKLSSLLVRVARDGEDTLQRKNSIQAEVDKAERHNYGLEQKYGKTKAKYMDDYIDVNAIKYQDYVTPDTYNATAQMANYMKDYMVTDIATTSVNALRKQSSDVLDNNRVTEIMRITQSSDILKNYAPLVQRIATSNWSNILIEQDGTFGLFRWKDAEHTELVPTEYAQDLLNTTLFNGINDRDNGNDTVYNKMVTGDYVASAFNAFFSPATTRAQRNAVEAGKRLYGSYFMRTPSDAPKNFMITAPRYAYHDKQAGDLFLIDNANEVEGRINSIINNQQAKAYDENRVEDEGVVSLGLEDVDPHNVNISNEQARLLITGGKIPSIKLTKQQIAEIKETPSKNGGVVKMETYNRDSHDDAIIVFGIYHPEDGTIKEVEYRGVKGGVFSESLRKNLHEHLFNQEVKAGRVVRKINQNHPIFKAYRRAFIGELVEAANSLDKFFELNDDGSIRYYHGLTGDLAKYNGRPVAKGGFRWDKDANGKLVPVYDPTSEMDLNNPLSHHGYDIYHTDKKGRVFDYDNMKLLGRVWSSNKFELNTDDGVRNYGNKVMQQFFNPFYGGDIQMFLATTRNAKGEIVDVRLDESKETDAELRGMIAEQNKAINNMIDNYVKDLVDQSVTRFEDFKQFITDPNAKADFEHIAEFMTNTNIMNYNFDELYEGNTKFYKDAQDFLKRAKEAQAGGDPYGMADFTQPDFMSPMTEGEDIAYMSKDADGNDVTISTGVKMRNKFRAVTINNSVRTDDATINRLINEAVQRAVAKGESEKTARPRIDKIIRSAHENLKANDAQSYITFEEWIRRIAGRGQLNQYQDLIAAIQDESKPVDAAKIGQFVQVQKNFYYDQYFDGNLGINVPRQVKNAEFVLIPRFIKGTELEEVYNLMKDNGIDQLNTRETTKAGKHNVLDLWDSNGVLVDNPTFAKFAKGYAEEYDYRHLYTQQETVQHTNTDNKISVQIVKKIVDNINNDSPLADVKKQFFDVYRHKILRSFNNLMDELKIPRDEKGHIQLNENGDIAGIDYDKLYEKLQNEALRNGMDSNLIDYFTPDPDGIVKSMGEDAGFTGANTLMPMYLSNMSSKTQSVVNAIFNSSITRQKINGFHCAQVTNIGFRARKKDIKTSKYLHYHEDANGKYTPYMEIAMTYSAFGINVNDPHYLKLRQDAEAQARKELEPDASKAANAFYKKFGAAVKKTKETQVAEKSLEDSIAERTKELFDQAIIKELEAEGLDKVVSYRIPTEGKQSMAIAKIAHFLDDTYGSTIIVPDEWVAQTGSDFDIDSVYGIQNRSYKALGGQVKRTKWLDKNSINKFDWYRYINRQLDGKVNTDISEDVKLAKEAIDNEYEKEYDRIQSTQTKAFMALPEDVSNKIKALDAEINEMSNFASKKDKLNYRLTEKFKLLSEEARTHEGEEAQHIADYGNNISELYDFINLASDKKYEAKGEAIEKLQTERDAAFARIAKQLGLKQYDEFVNADPYEINSDTALDNKMVESMIEILSSDESTEENLSASTFANITEAQNKVQSKGSSSLIAQERANRSPYNFLDQASYMNDVMGGARLKAFSVTRDTFCSVCNTVHPTLNKKYAIKIKYEDGREITHQQYGWSDNNRNVDGYLLTPYSSQTSAHAFDAVKNGSVPNVNEYTFAAYKLFPEIGSNYDCAVSFIMQPGITRIVDAYNRNESVYSDVNKNPIHEAIRSIAEDLGIKKLTVADKQVTVDRVPINTLVDTLNKKYGAKFKSIWKGAKKIAIGDNSTMADCTFDVDKQFRRNWAKSIDEMDSFAKETTLLYDLGTILQFERLNSIAQKVTDLARVCNPDKFGAKQTIFSTNKVFDDIQELLLDDTPALQVNGENILEAIYPNVSGGLDNYIAGKGNNTNPSAYPTLDAFLRYSTGTSIKAARPLFKTQSPSFRSLIYGLQSVLDGKGKVRIDEATYNDFEKYVLGKVYADVPLLNRPAIFSSTGEQEHFELAKTNNPDTAIQEEMARIYGYGRQANFNVKTKTKVKNEKGEEVEVDTTSPVKIEDINHPTKREVSEFNQLTPAQKVEYLKTHSFGDNIFKHLDTTLDTTNRFNKRGQQTIELIQDNVDPEILYDYFDSAIHNSNPIVAGAALDLIKYSFLVEGFKMSRNGISGVIKNSALYEDLMSESDKSIVDAIDERVVAERDPSEAEVLYEDYVRSHPMMRGIPKAVNRKTNGVYDLATSDQGMIVLSGKQLDVNEDVLEQYNIANFKWDEYTKAKVPIFNSYVRIRQEGKKDYTLYKIYAPIANEERADVENVYLVPMNKLETNEHGTFSANPDNNLYPRREYYEAIINQRESGLAKDQKPNIDITKYRYVKPAGVAREKVLKQFDLNKPTDTDKASEVSQFDAAIEHIDRALGNVMSSKGTTFILAPVFDKYFAYAPDGAISQQTIYSRERDKDGNPVKYDDKGNPTTDGSGEYKKTRYYDVDIHKPGAWKIIQRINKELIWNNKYDNNLPSWAKPYAEAIKLAREANVNMDSIYQVDLHQVSKAGMIMSSSIEDRPRDPAPEESVTTDNASAAFDTEVSAGLLRKKIAKANQQSYIAIMMGDDPVAAQLRRDLNAHNVSKDINSIKANSTLVAYAGYRFAQAKRDEILDNVERFAIADGKFVSMKSNEVFKAIRENADVRRRYLKVLNEAKQFYKDLEEYDTLDIDAIDGDEKIYYQGIKDAVRSVRNNTTLNEAMTLFVNEYLDKMSTNPLIQDDILSVSDGYWSQSFLDAQIGDLQHASNPMVQIVTKLITDDIQAKDMQGRDRLAAINKEINRIISDAKAKGESCSWNDIIDQYGRLKQDYNDDYIKDYEALNDAMTQASIEHGLNSVEYLKARLAKRKWLAKNVEQEVGKYHGPYVEEEHEELPFGEDDGRSYYERLNDLEEHILQTAPEIYSEYCKRVADRNALYKERIPGIINDALEEKIDAAEKAVRGLTSEWIVDPATGNIIPKVEYDEEHPYSNNPERRIQQRINSKNSANQLANYLETRRKIQGEVYTDEVRKEWKSTLDKNIAIIDKYEQRDQWGKLVTSRSELCVSHEDYAKALEWMHNNARTEVRTDEQMTNEYLAHKWELTDEQKANMTEAQIAEHIALNKPLIGVGPKEEAGSLRSIFLEQELAEAYNILKGNKQARAFYRTILEKHKGIVNKYGEVDARLLTDDEIKQIKAKQETDMSIRGASGFDDRTIMSNAPKSPIVYTTEFYQGLSVDGKDNVKHLELVKQFNELVRPYWDGTTNVLQTARMPIEVLKKMSTILDELDGTKSKLRVNKDDVKCAIAFRKKYTEIVLNEKEFNLQRDLAATKGNEYLNAWLDANTEFDTEGDGKAHAHSRIYGYIKPKDEYASKFINQKKTRAFKLLDDCYETVNTSAYEEKYHEMKEKARKAKDPNIFNAWYEANTIYNPHTHEREPLMCWRTSKLRNKIASEYVPTSNNVTRTVNEDYRNENYHAGNEGTMLGRNFNRETADAKYHNETALNDSQREFRNYVQDRLEEFTRVNRGTNLTAAQRYILNGQMPAEYSEEALKSFGSKGNRLLDAAREAGEGIEHFLGFFGNKEIPNDQNPIDYHTPMYDMPMTTLLRTKNSITKKIVRPNRVDFVDGEQGDKEYAEKLNQYHKELQERQRINLEEHAKVMNKDWEHVFQDFIAKAIHYNAVQDNRELAQFTRTQLDRANVYDQNSATTKFKRDRNASTENNPQYVKVKDTNLQEQFDVWYRRLFCDQWREPTSAKLHRISSYLQNFTSSTYMMLNIRGGIANVTVGLANIAGEAFAQDYFGFKNWITANARYNIGIPDYLKNMFSNKSDTLEGAIIKYFNVVEFDRLNNLEVNDETKGLVETVRDFMYSPQSMGEHYMQNTAMLTMMDSHRLILDPAGEAKGKPKYKIVSIGEYSRDAEALALRDYLNDDQWAEFTTMQEELRNDPQEMKKYAWFRRDLVTDYALHRLNTKQQAEFIKKRREIQKQKKEEFEKASKLYEQFELGNDRELHFKKGSILDQLDIIRQGQETSDALQLIAGFRNKVIFVNKKIHGVYDRLGAAQIEKHVWGSLVMQYHKHIYPGFMKRWRRRGYYNEERGTIEKGCYTALKDFLSIPFDDAKYKARMSEGETGAWKGVQNFVSSSFNYLRNLRTVWNLIPEYERGNIKRNLGDISGIASAFFTIFALRMIQDDKDKDSIAFNLALYEADRLATETSEFNPVGAITQAKTLWSQPVAAESIITDLTKTLGELCALAIEGDDYDGYYHSGIHAGESRLGVYAQRRAPVYRQWYTMSTIAANNKAYRIGDNTLTFLGLNPKGIAEDIRGVNLSN